MKMIVLREQTLYPQSSPLKLFTLRCCWQMSCVLVIWSQKLEFIGSSLSAMGLSSFERYSKMRTPSILY